MKSREHKNPQLIPIKVYFGEEEYYSNQPFFSVKESKAEITGIKTGCDVCRREATPIMQGKLIQKRFTFKFSDHNMDAGSPLLLPQLM